MDGVKEDPLLLLLLFNRLAPLFLLTNLPAVKAFLNNEPDVLVLLLSWSSWVVTLSWSVVESVSGVLWTSSNFEDGLVLSVFNGTVVVAAVWLTSEVVDVGDSRLGCDKLVGEMVSWVKGLNDLNECSSGLPT